MDDQRTGRIFREVRIKRGWRQIDVAVAAKTTQSVISDLERGRLEQVSLTTLRRIGRALDIRVGVQAWWRGGEVDRLLDRGHASLVEHVVRRLTALGWEPSVEFGFNHFGDRGSVDVVAWHAADRILLVIEVKTRIGDVQELLATFGRKVRIVPVAVEQQRGWKPGSVARMLVLPDSRSNRSVVDAHAASFDAVWPDRTAAMWRWIRRPVDRRTVDTDRPSFRSRAQTGGIVFVPIARLGTTPAVRLTERVRPRRRMPDAASKTSAAELAGPAGPAGPAAAETAAAELAGPAMM
jgi:transcriptional regulator with XRE-family HTH domain